MNDTILIIDMQKVYLEGEPWGCAHMQQTTDNILRLLQEAPQKAPQSQIYLTEYLPNPQPVGDWITYNDLNREINENPVYSELIPELQPYTAKFPVCSKHIYSSMGIPEVRDAAQKSGRLVVTGVVAECCVLATALAAIDLGIHVIYLTDAVSGISVETEKATELVLDGLSYAHVDLMTTQEYLESLS